MQRLALAIIAVAIFAGIAALLVRAAARGIERAGGSTALTTGDSMQKAAFFLLLCLILYVSVNGAS